MPRIAGINLPEQKRIVIALTYIYGIGYSLSKKILTEADINISKKAKDLTPDEINSLKKIIEKNHKIEGEKRRDIMMSKKRLKDIEMPDSYVKHSVVNTLIDEAFDI